MKKSKTAQAAAISEAAQPQPPAVICESLTKRYGPVHAVHELSFELRPGEILALLGPSGCGKTTSLRMLAGLEQADSGRIIIGGREVAGPGGSLPPEQRRVGMVFQHYALFPHLSVAENVAFGLPRKPAPEARVREMLALVGLSALGHRMPHELSGGQQQRVALARALAPAPAVLLLDEPFSNLDARMRNTVREEVRDILVRSGTTAIFVTHDQEEALFIGDRIAILNGGRLEQIGSPEAIYHHPRTHFVAEFMGNSGFLPATVSAEGLQTEIGLLLQRTGLPPGAKVDVLLRPDDLSLEADPEGDAVVRRRLFRGMHNLYRLDLASGRMIECLAPHDLLIEAGARVRLRVTAEHGFECFRDGQAIRAIRGCLD